MQQEEMSKRLTRREKRLLRQQGKDHNKENYQDNDFSNLKIFASHGTADQVIPVEWARKSPAILEGLGIKTTYKEYPIGHGVSPQNFYDLKSWLLEK